MLVEHFARGQNLGQALFLAEIARLLPELRPGDAGRAMPPGNAAVGVLAEDLVDEQILQGDDVTLEPDHLGDVGDLARAVAQALRLGR